MKKKITLAAVSVLVTIFAIEAVFAVWAGIANWGHDTGPAAHITDPTLPEFFVSNPAYPGIDSHGFRDCSAAPVDIGSDRKSIYFAGDSVVFGYGVSCEEAFPYRAGRILADEFELDWDTINAGVGGYNTFNEVRAYQRFAETHHPDIVVLTTCLNDFVNPRLHWSNQGTVEMEIPPAAIPNLEYDERVAQPFFRGWQREVPWRRFVTFRTFKKVWDFFFQIPPPYDEQGYPLGITGEIGFPITQLLVENAPELAWYEGLLEELKATCDASGTTLVVALVPLAYQLDPEYPYHPQQRLEEMCEGLGVGCLDLLPGLGAVRDRGPFLSRVHGQEDYWHLSGVGHEVVAREVVGFLEGRGWLGGGE